MKYYLLTIFALMLFGVPAVGSRFPVEVNYVAQLFSDATNQLAAVILSHNPKTVEEIRSAYNSPIAMASSVVSNNVQDKVKILLVPGHEPHYGGAEFGSLKERNMTVELAQDLQGFIDSNDHYQVFVTRDNNKWMPDFANYFKNNWQDIIDWEKASKDDSAHQVILGTVTAPTYSVYHNSAPTDVALRLYGITKWANENNIDITIHIHFNDDREHASGVPGKFNGFAIYIPEHQYENSTTSRVLAESIFKRLEEYNPVSDLKGESSGVVEDPSLIAIGAYNTANAASILIEYSYIYEQQLADPDTRSMAIKNLAFQTYLGLQDFFDSSNSINFGNLYDNSVLPYTWIHPITTEGVQNDDVFALQTAMHLDGEYPPSGYSLSDCPITGKFGPCTRLALGNFQKKYSITGENNVVGEKTLQVLNQNFGTK